MIEEIEKDRLRRKYNWFKQSFSKLASDVSKDGEDLQGTYQLISANLHGVWGLTFGVSNPEPGVLDFRGYPNKTEMYKHAADMLDQSVGLYKKIWNEVAVCVGAQQVL